MKGPIGAPIDNQQCGEPHLWKREGTDWMSPRASGSFLLIGSKLWCHWMDEGDGCICWIECTDGLNESVSAKSVKARKRICVIFQIKMNYSSLRVYHFPNPTLPLGCKSAGRIVAPHGRLSIRSCASSSCGRGRHGGGQWKALVVTSGGGRIPLLCLPFTVCCCCWLLLLLNGRRCDGNGSTVVQLGTGICINSRGVWLSQNAGKQKRHSAAMGGWCRFTACPNCQLYPFASCAPRAAAMSALPGR